MATVINAHIRNVNSLNHYTYTDASTVGNTTLNQSVTLLDRDADTKEWVRSGLTSPYFPTWIGWRVERAAAEHTISGDITFAIYGKASIASAGRIHARLFKRTTGGSDVDTLIASADAVADLPTGASVVHTFTATPPAPVTVAYGERLLWRIYVTRRSADFDTAVFTLDYGSTIKPTKFTLTETVTYIPDKTFMQLTSGTLNGISGFFDVGPFASGTPATGVVNTTASGTEIEWTQTAGGSVLAFISPRFKHSWAMVAAGQHAGGGLYCHESNIAANCTFRVKMFRRKPDGTETLVYTSSATVEFLTSATLVAAPQGTLAAETMFAEDDRIVYRIYIIPIGTMGGSRTCTVSYNGDTLNSGVPLYDIAEFKGEGDPSVGAVPSGGSVLGVSNGQ